jgi:hypothetical protein
MKRLRDSLSYVSPFIVYVYGWSSNWRRKYIVLADLISRPMIDFKKIYNLRHTPTLFGESKTLVLYI